jgi:tyrosyl-tRNA synthetase
MTSSTSEAMRLIKQGGVKINSEKVLDEKFEVKKGSEAIYQVGKRKFLKINIKK